MQDSTAVCSPSYAATDDLYDDRIWCIDLELRYIITKYTQKKQQASFVIRRITDLSNVFALFPGTAEGLKILFLLIHCQA